MLDNKMLSQRLEGVSKYDGQLTDGQMFESPK